MSVNRFEQVVEDLVLMVRFLSLERMFWTAAPSFGTLHLPHRILATCVFEKCRM
jgi:hypothetical protein